MIAVYGYYITFIGIVNRGVWLRVFPALAYLRILWYTYSMI